MRSSSVRGASAAVVDRVARDLARGGHHLRLIDEREARFDGPRSHELPHRYDVCRGAKLQRLTPKDWHPPLAMSAVCVWSSDSSSAIPLSTFSAVRTPGSVSPSSTSVIATAGCIPTTTVCRVEHARHRRDVRDHAADERIDDVERRDVDEHAARAGLADARRELILQLHGEPVVHVHLDRDQEEITQPQNRDAIHVASPLSARAT